MRPITRRLPFGDTVFLPAGCLHWPIGERDLLRAWVNELDRAPNGVGLLLGDSLDVARSHYRNHIRSYKDDENSQAALDEWVRRDVGDLAKVLEPVKGKLLGVILGNHYWTFLDQTNSEQYLCQLLGIPYLGPVGFIRLDFADGGRIRHSVTIFAHHTGGSAGGRTTGGDVAALARMEAGFDADIYVAGHTHRRHAWKEPKIALTKHGNPRAIEVTRVMVRAGAFLKGFGADNPSPTKPHVASYAEHKCLRPTDLGYVRIDINMRRANARAGQTDVTQHDVRADYRVSW